MITFVVKINGESVVVGAQPILNVEGNYPSVSRVSVVIEHPPD